MSHASSVGGNVQKSSSSKAAAILTSGAYSQYVSTTKWRERRWRLFQHSHSGSFDPQFLASVHIILLTLNTLAVIVPTIIVLAASSALATPKKEWQPTLDTVARQMH